MSRLMLLITLTIYLHRKRFETMMVYLPLRPAIVLLFATSLARLSKTAPTSDAELADFSRVIVDEVEVSGEATANNKMQTQRQRKLVPIA